MRSRVKLNFRCATDVLPEVAKSSDFRLFAAMLTVGVLLINLLKSNENLRLASSGKFLDLWFGTRGSEVQILSPRPYLFVSVPETWVTECTGYIGHKRRVLEPQK